MEWNPGKLHYTECNVNWRPLSRAFEDYIQNGHCPYGATGDRLWVKETFCHNPNGDPPYWYAADGIEPEACDMDGFARYRNDGRPASPWAPSIHMPRRASRITLEIEAVRVERLQDISEEDCRAEGCKGGNGSIPGYAFSATPREHYRHVWKSINGPGSWDANPFVWVIQFRRVKP